MKHIQHIVKKTQRFVLLGLLGILLTWAVFPAFTPNASAGKVETGSPDASKSYSLPALRNFNRALLLVKEQYVDPSRLHPREMLLATLEAVNNRTPAVLIAYPSPKEVLVQVGKKKQLFSIEELTSLWDMSFRLRDIFRFVDASLDPSVDRVGVERIAINGMLSTLDPHSILLEPKYFEEVDSKIKGQFGGCGFLLSLRNGEIVIMSALDNSPAQRAGIRDLDKLQQIDGNSTTNMDIDEAITLLRGEPGSAVKLTVLHKGETEPKTITVIRDVIKVDSVTYKPLEGSIGYMRVKSFQANTAHEVREAMDKMEESTGGLKGLIFDLRGNGGGLLDQSVALADIFLDGGPVVFTQGASADNSEEEQASEGNFKPKLPLIVLVDEGSASASEIFAAAIQNRQYGSVFGRTTFGKGSVQIPFAFPDKSALKLTVAQYLTPGKESIQSVGITPDVVLQPVVVKNKESLDLFPDKRLREENLDAHLNDSRTVAHQSAYQMLYLFDAKDPLSQESINSEIKNIVQEDYEINFAARVLRQTKSYGKKAILDSAASVVKQAQEEEEARLQEALQKYGVDWSEGTAKEVPSVTLRVLKPVRAKAGGNLKIELEATNTGKVVAWRVYGLTQSLTGLFAEREFLFGKLSPGESKRWAVEIKIPKDAVPRRDAFKVNLKGNGQHDLGSLDVPVTIEGRPHPILAFSYYIDAEKGLVNDGYVHLGEKTDLVVLVKNEGAGIAEKPLVLLKNLNGSGLFIDVGRQELKSLASGASGSVRLSFTVKKPMELAQLELMLIDSVMSDGWSKKLSLPVKKVPAVAAVKAKGFVKVKATKLAILASPEEGASVIGYAHVGDVLHKTSSVPGMLHVRALDNISGFVSEKDVETLPVSPDTKVKLAAPIEVQYAFSPPQIRLAHSGGILTTNKKKYELGFRVKSQFPVKDAYIFVNDRKADYYALDSKGATDVPFTADIQLKPGVNVITMIARADDTYAQREVVTVYSTAGDPYLAQNSSNEAEAILE